MAGKTDETSSHDSGQRKSDKGECCAGVKECSLKCLYLNARSLVNKIDYFRAEIQSRDPDIIGITETWGHKDIFDGEINVNDEYNLYRKDRVEQKGGGVFQFQKSILCSLPVVGFPLCYIALAM